MKRLLLSSIVAAATLVVAGCDMLGIESPEKIAAARDADGRAIGAACRHAGRALEDCYLLNRKADRAAVFAGWRDMNDYMRENKIEAVVPQLATTTEVAATKAVEAEAPAKPKTDKEKSDKVEKSAKTDKEKPVDKEKAKDAKDPKEAKDLKDAKDAKEKEAGAAKPTKAAHGA